MGTRGTLTHEEYLSRRRFDRLDGVRAISVLLVFTSHPGYGHVWPALHGPAGVSIFFVLSGFLITTLLAREYSRNGRVDLVAFYVRRIFRIYPTYVLVLVGYCVLILVLGLEADRRSAFVANIPYFVAFLPEHSFFGPHAATVPFDGSWSIGIEEKFYFLWPVLGFVVLGLLARLRMLLLAVVVGVLAFVGVYTSWGEWVAPYALIALGAIGALALHSRRGFGYAARLGRPVPLALTTLVLVCLQLGTSRILSPENLYVAYGLVVALVLVGLVVSTARVPDFLTHPALAYLGRISYVFYLVHNFALNFVELLVPRSTEVFGLSVVSTAIALVVSVVVSGAIHRWFEEPLRVYGARLSKRGARARAPETLPGQPPGPP